ncbi:TIR domain-containing protein [Actinoplanes sp. NPDC023801]|uniref:TIR domain-containing protein n=1 Tax=Actinoplanes sp. NPDC023801 TaxID=3154595 RepID=UPI0033C1651C
MTDSRGLSMTFDGFISYSHAADGRLAPAVQHGLHRLAKPWHRRRALWIFRDQTGLSVTPALWSSIQRALDGSEWFVLLASPTAAQSAWVNREIAHWIATKPADRILPVVTDGEWRWDPVLGDLSADSTAVPEALRGVFAEEPLFLDLRWARDDHDLSLRHSRFRNAIAQLAAPMHGISKDELEGEDVRQYRRARRLRRVAVAAVALLTAVAGLTGVLAGHNADRATAASVEARHQQEVASQQRGNAERSAEEARRQEENARTQEARARDATNETKRQEQRAREQQRAAGKAATEARRQEANARRQERLANRAQKLAEEQRAVAREQSELARQSIRETARQKIIAEQQQSLAGEAAAEAERQRTIARQQQRFAEESAAEARRQEAIARANQRKAEESAEEARRQEENAAEQKRITVGRRLLNQAKATVSNDPETALRLGIAAEAMQPGTETRAELAGLVTSTRRLGAIGDARTVAYGPGNVLAVVESEFSASLWNVADPAQPVRLAGLDDSEHYVGDPVFSPDGRTLIVTGGRDFRPILFDVSDPAHPAMLGILPEPFAAWLTFSPDGQTLAVSSPEKKWSLWDMSDRTRPTRLADRTMAHGAPITFSADGRTVVTAGAPGTVWDITDRTAPTEIGTLAGDWRRLTFHPVRPLLVTYDGSGNMAFWHMNNRTKPLRFNTTAARGYDARFSDDGLVLATSDSDGSARLWDMTANAPVHLADLDDHSGYAETIAFSPDGRTLATAGIVGSLSLWSVRAHGEPEILGRGEGEFDRALSAGITPDGQRLITTHFRGTATVWDLSGPAGPVERATVPIHPTYIDAAAISPDGRIVAALGWDRKQPLTLTDVSDPSAPVPLGGLPASGRTLAFSPDGSILAIGKGFDVTLWDLADPRRPVPLADLPGNDLVWSVAFSPDGLTVAVSTGRTVNLWNVTDRSGPVELGTLQGHSDRVLTVTFSPDGRTLATGSEDRTASLWNVDGPLRRQAILTGNRAAVWSVAFTADGRTLATGTKDETVAFWDAAELSGPVRVAVLRGTDLRSTALVFHPDGRRLATSGNSSSIRAVLWDHSALNALRADPAAAACAVTGRGFTQQEWDSYVPETPYRPTCP